MSLDRGKCDVGHIQCRRNRTYIAGQILDETGEIVNKLIWFSAFSLYGAFAQATEVSPAPPVIAPPLIVAGNSIDVRHQLVADNTMTVSLISRSEARTILKMQMSDGDKFSFALPGQPDSLLSFERMDDGLRVNLQDVSFEELARAD